MKNPNQPVLPGMEDYMETNLRFADPVPHLAAGASEYAKRVGKVHNAEQFKGVGVGPGYHALFPIVQRQIMSPQEMSPKLKSSYDALRAETRSQYEFLTSPKEKGGLGVNVEVTKENPYESTAALREDVVKNNRLRVLSTESTGGHTVLSNEENDMFRAVHDAFGHLATGRNFAREGEEAAYGSHSKMFSDTALPALASETRAQNSYLINKGEFTPNMPFEVPEWATSLEGKPKTPRTGRRRPPAQPTLF